MTLFIVLEGSVGKAAGIAFRDITENFLASIFLSMQRPFETGDLLEVSGVTGYVQQLNMRTTILMTLDSNLVQIPNASVYKSNLRNFTTDSNRREDFVVGIGYDDSINEAQEIARKVLAGRVLSPSARFAQNFNICNTNVIDSTGPRQYILLYTHVVGYAARHVRSLSTELERLEKCAGV